MFVLIRNNILLAGQFSDYPAEETTYPSEADAIAAARQITAGPTPPIPGDGFFVVPDERSVYERVIFVPADGGEPLERGSRVTVPVPRADTDGTLDMVGTLVSLPTVRYGGTFCEVLIHDIPTFEGNSDTPVNPWGYSDGSRQEGQMKVELFRLRRA